MARRSTPERIDQARRDAVRNRLPGTGMPADTAEAWLVEWEALAARDGIARDVRFWTAGWDWIDTQRAMRRPKT